MAYTDAHLRITLTRRQYGTEVMVTGADPEQVMLAYLHTCELCDNEPGYRGARGQAVDKSTIARASVARQLKGALRDTARAAGG